MSNGLCTHAPRSASRPVHLTSDSHTGPTPLPKTALLSGTATALKSQIRHSNVQMMFKRRCISAKTSRRHAYIILTPFNLLYSKTGVYRGIHYFSYFCSKTKIVVLVRTASAEISKISEFLYENFHFLGGKFQYV